MHKGTRHKMRKALIQAIYAYFMDTDNPRHVLQEALKTFKVGDDDRERGEEMFSDIIHHHDSLTISLSGALEHWDLDRIGIVERAVIFLALYELQYKPDVPMEVAIDEAVRLAKEFAGDDSARFVNGIIDAISSRLDASELQDPS